MPTAGLTRGELIKSGYARCCRPCARSDCQISARDWTRGPRATTDEDEGLLRLQKRIRRRTEHAYLPRMPWTAWSSASAELAGCRIRDAGGRGAWLHHQRAQR